MIPLPHPHDRTDAFDRMRRAGETLAMAIRLGPSGRQTLHVVGLGPESARPTAPPAQERPLLGTFLRLHGVEVPEDKATLGTLVSELRRHDLLSENGANVLRALKMQRNYLTHSLFDLFSARIEETVLPRTALLPEDVTLFTEKAWILEQNLGGLSDIAEERIAQLVNGTLRQPASDARLFRPQTGTFANQPIVVLLPLPARAETACGGFTAQVGGQALSPSPGPSG